jgi:hypothetical protein
LLARARTLFLAAISAVASPLAPLGLGSDAHAGPWIPAPGEYYSEISGYRGVADTYYDSEGARFAMPSGGVFERRSLSAYTEFGWKQRLTFIVAAPVVSQTHRIDDIHRTQTGFGDALVGFRFALARGARALAVEVELQAPLGYQADDRHQLGASPDSQLAHQLVDVPSPGSGRQEATAWLLAGSRTPFVTGFAQAGAGYRYRERELADQIALSADVGVWVSNSWLIAGRYSGALSNGTGDTLLDEQSEHVVGPEVRVRVDDRLDVFFGSRHVASGKNVTHSDGYYMGFAFKQTRLDRLQGFLGGTRRP